MTIEEMKALLPKLEQGVQDLQVRLERQTGAVELLNFLLKQEEQKKPQSVQGQEKKEDTNATGQ